MRLAEFILRDMEAILAQWEAFATTLLPAAGSMEPLALRDHAQQILMAAAEDLTTVQTRNAQREKSMGRAPKLMDAPATAAQTHALLRARSGFDINQLAAEYRALRASVLRLWIDDCEPEVPHLDDMVRFNEAIDQALAESVGFFNEQVNQARNLFLGMLECCPGMSRTQMIARAKRRGLRLSFRATAPCPPGEAGVFELRFNDGAGECLMLARLQRVGNRNGGVRRTRRAHISRPPARDPRQATPF